MADHREISPPGRMARRMTSAGAALACATLLAVTMATIGSVGDPGPLTARMASAAEGKPPLNEPGIPVRIRVPDLGIDLPVVSSERTVPGNARDYPLCDVAQYWTIYDLPGAPGTSWIYAHAQPGMFLPLFLTANATGGAGLIGKTVTVQLRDGRLLRYRVSEVKQHAYNRRIALRSRPSEHRLVLQTSEGPPGTIPKLQVAARLVGATWTDEPAPRARPRACWQPRTSTGGTSNRNRNGDRGGSQATPVPAAVAVDVTGSGGSTDATALALGGGAVLLGSLLFAVYLVRRPPAGHRRPPARHRRPPAGQRPPPVAQRPPPVAQRPPPVAQRRRP